MSIPSVNGPVRVAPVAAEAAAPSTPARPPSAPVVVEIDEKTQLPVAPRFPWLSRLSQQLESSAKQRPAFQAAPILGDNLDKSA